MTNKINQKLSRVLVNWALNSPKTVYALVAALVLALLIQLPRINIDTDPENMLSSDNPARLFHHQVKQQFKLYDSIVLGIVNPNGIYNPQSLALTKQLSDFILTIDGVVHSEVIAPSLMDNMVNQQQGTLHFSWLMTAVPSDQQQSLALQRAIERLPLLHNTMASDDGQAIAIYIPLLDKTQSYRIAQQLRRFTEGLASNHQYYISGLPVAENQFGHEMFVQMAISAPLAGVMIFMMLWLFIRQPVVVASAMLVAMSTVIITMGSLIGLGYSVHILSSMIAIFLMPIAVVDAIHVLSQFKEKLQSNARSGQIQSVNEVIKHVIGDLFQPMLFTTITSAIGFLSLMLTPIEPVQVFGGFVGLGIFIAFALTMTLLPAYLSRLSQQTINKLSQPAKKQTNMLAYILASLARLTRHHSKMVMLVLALFTLGGAVGIAKITINDNPVRWFKSDHQISIADRVLNQHFAGTYNAYLVLEHQPLQPQVNKLIDNIRSDATLLGITLPASSRGPLGLSQWIEILDVVAFEQTLTPAQSQFIARAITRLSEQVQQQVDFYQPQHLAYLDRLSSFLRANQHVGKVNALPDVVKTVNRELISGDAIDYALPTTGNGVSQVLLQYQSSHRPNDLYHFVSPNRLRTLLWLQLKSGDNQTMQAVIAATNEFIKENPLPDGVRHNWAGKAYINVVWQQEMVAGMITSLGSAFILVLLMMVALFRSIRYGLLAMLPLTITIISIYGLIGWVGKDYDMPIAVLSSLTLGLSVDFAIHFIERYRYLLAQGQSVPQALSHMFEQPARAISRNALVISLGFTPLLFAPLVPYITVGLFLASIMLLSAIVTLTLIPALLINSQPRNTNTLELP